MSYHLFLDDERNPQDVFWIALPCPSEPWLIVRSYGAFVEMIMCRGLPEFVSFDHDLGDTDTRTGMDCAKWIVEFCLDNNARLPGFAAHSKNDPGYDNIAGLLSAFEKHQQSALLPRLFPAR